MPQLGEAVSEGTVTKWMKKIGEAVKIDEPLFEVSTDKVDTEVPSPASGFLTKVVVNEGDTVEVGTVLAFIESEQNEEVSEKITEMTPLEPQTALISNISASSVEAAPPPPPPLTSTDSGGADNSGRESSFVASPIIRHLLNENGLEEKSVKGTGPGGRITRNDVELVINGPLGHGPSGSENVSENLQDSEVHVSRTPKYSFDQSDNEVVPFSNIRKRTAEHMIRSKKVSPHSTVSIEADFENVEKLRSRYHEGIENEFGIKLTYLPFVAMSVVKGLREFPRLNASVDNESLIIHKDIHLGIAVDIKGEGLIVPVIHRASEMNLIGLARSISDVALKARTKKLSADDIVGGTFTITNPGPWGTLLTVPIINQPEVGILGTDGVKRKPVVVRGEGGDEAITIHSIGNLSITFDHRAVDGGYAAAFIASVAHHIATTDWDTLI